MLALQYISHWFGAPMNVKVTSPVTVSIWLGSEARLRLCQGKNCCSYVRHFAGTVHVATAICYVQVSGRLDVLKLFCLLHVYWPVRLPIMVARLLQTCSACHWPYSSFEPYGSVKVGTGKLYTSYFKRFGILNKLSSALLQAGDMMNEFNHLSAEMWCNFLFWHQSDEQEVWLVHYFGASSWKWFRCHQGLG